MNLFLKDLSGSEWRTTDEPKPHGQVRRSQVITTWGPGALIDLPRHSAIVGGLDTWPKIDKLEEIIEPRLTRKLALMTGVPNPRLYAPPADTAAPGEPQLGIGVWRFPEWFVVQEDGRRRGRGDVAPAGASQGARRQGPVRRPAGRADPLRPRLPARPRRRSRLAPLRARHGDACNRQLWLDERGTGGDLADLRRALRVRQAAAALHEAAELEPQPARDLPWRAAVAWTRTRTRTAGSRAAC